MPKVLYFPLNGLGLSIRLLLKHKGVAFDDQHPGEGDVKPWPELKAEFPLRGGLPWYTNDDGAVFTQSMSILLRHSEPELQREQTNSQAKSPGTMGML